MHKEAILLNGGYCNSLTQYSKFITREVKIGDVPMGAHHPIRIQSMTTTDTMDTFGTVEQTIRMVESGCEYVRITAPSIKEAENLANIKKELRYRGYNVPLVADIHFTPNAAEVAARIVEKVRVNPGNYADKKKFENIDYTDAEYEAELERIYSKFSPLVNICKENGTAMRIGTNHGSLSDRIMSRYGDTPKGMVESAMEFIRICEDLNFYNLVISMKSSNTQVMVQAYRLLVQTMVAEGMNYPLHLGVTEAGDGEDGRIKSAVGIGTLLADGLGDTIRVSLTEDPEFEAPVAKALAARFEKQRGKEVPEDDMMRLVQRQALSLYHPFQYQRRASQEANSFGGHQVPRVLIDLSHQNLKDPAILGKVGYDYSLMLDKYNLSDQACDMVYLGDNLPSFNLPGGLKQLYNANTWSQVARLENCYPLFDGVMNYKNVSSTHQKLNFIKILAEDLDAEQLNGLQNVVLVLHTEAENAMQILRYAFIQLLAADIKLPVVVKSDYPNVNLEDFQLYTSTDLGGLLIDGFGDGVWISSNTIDLADVNSVSFGVLQATRTRISKTEYISCPSCGRTLFDLQETTQAIRSRTSHLKGIKIGIMGCIVNGPGEMADADYGYVGAGVDRITLYRGQQVVKKNVKTADAIDELIGIIREDGNWVE